MALLRGADSLDLPTLIAKLPKARDVAQTASGITFSVDGNTDAMPIVLSTVDNEWLAVTGLQPWPQGHVAAALVATNAWNGSPQSHGTLSYWAPDCLAVEAHLLLSGGVSRTHLKHWLNNFLGRIPGWEALALETLSEVEDDSQIADTETGPRIGSGAIAQFALGFLQGLLEE